MGRSLNAPSVDDDTIMLYNKLVSLINRSKVPDEYKRRIIESIPVYGDTINYTFLSRLISNILRDINQFKAVEEDTGEGGDIVVPPPEVPDGGGTTDPPVDEGAGTMKENVSFDEYGRFTDGIWTYMKGDGNNVSVILDADAKSDELFNSDTVILDKENMPYERLKGVNKNIYLTTSYSNMFASLPSNVTSLTINGWTNTNVTDMSAMFTSCSSLTTLTLGDDFDISNVTDMDSMFTDCNDLKSLTLCQSAESIITYLPEAKWSIKDNEQADTNIIVKTTGNPNNIEWIPNKPALWNNPPWTFEKEKVLGDVNFNENNSVTVDIWTYTMIENTKNLSVKLNARAFYEKVGDTTEIVFDYEDMPYERLIDRNGNVYITILYNKMFSTMFSSLSPITAASLTIDNWTNRNVTSMDRMFNDCSVLTSLTLGDKFDTSKVTNMLYMFDDCFALTSLTLGANFDTSSVTNMRDMFSGCSKLTSLDLSKFDTSKVENMSYMFNDCSVLTTLTLGDNFYTSSVEDMRYMFNNCSKLKSLDLSKFDTSKVTYMHYMFASCSKLTSLMLGANFNTSSVTDMQYMQSMFNGCSELKSLTLYKSAESIIKMLPGGTWKIDGTENTIEITQGSLAEWSSSQPNNWDTIPLTLKYQS